MRILSIFYGSFPPPHLYLKKPPFKAKLQQLQRYRCIRSTPEAIKMAIRSAAIKKICQIRRNFREYFKIFQVFVGFIKYFIGEYFNNCNIVIFGNQRIKLMIKVNMKVRRKIVRIFWNQSIFCNQSENFHRCFQRTYP